MLRIDPEQLQNTDMKRILEYLVEKHNPAHAEMLQSYYIGEHDITTRRMHDQTKPNNKLVNNLAAYITDTLTGYFMGKPAVYSADEGSEEFLESELKARAGDPISYYEQLREFPSKFRHAFLSAGKDSGFNLMVLSDRMAELDMHDELAPRIGNFKWTEKFGGDVKFVDDPNGKWILSYVPANPNNHVTKNGKKAPANTHLFVSSADPFKFENTKGGKKSNGGGCVFLKHDNLLDPLSKETKLWSTKRTVCTYNNRVDLKETYKEDMLMQSIYFGTKIFPENNVNDIYEYFKLHGFEEYLQYQIINGVREANPGFFSSLEMKQRMFALVMDYIENHGMAERHREILQECYDIKGLEDMTNHDLFTAFGGCMLAIYYEEKARPTQQLAEGEVDPMVKYILGIS